MSSYEEEPLAEILYSRITDITYEAGRLDPNHPRNKGKMIQKMPRQAQQEINGLLKELKEIEDESLKLQTEEKLVLEDKIIKMYDILMDIKTYWMDQEQIMGKGEHPGRTYYKQRTKEQAEESKRKYDEYINSKKKRGRDDDDEERSTKKQNTQSYRKTEPRRGNGSSCLIQ